MSQPLGLMGLLSSGHWSNRRGGTFTLAIPTHPALTVLLLEAWRPALGGVGRSTSWECS